LSVWKSIAGVAFSGVIGFLEFGLVVHGDVTFLLFHVLDDFFFGRGLEVDVVI
jgi:hypothetical protein